VLHRFVLHNDRIQEASETSLTPGQVGLLSGWGIFTTIKVSDGVLFAYERHWARLSRDSALLRVPMPVEPEALKRQLLELVEANQTRNATLRLVMVRNTGSMWAGPSTGRAVDIIALTADSKDWGNAVKLGYVEQARHAASPFSGTKILSWAYNLTWVEEAQERGLDEVVLLNEHGHVAECTSANIFAAAGNVVWTPPLSAGCLPGITREILLNEIHVPGIEIVEKDLTPSDLEAADEVFITSTTRNLLPVGQIEGRKVGRSERICTALEAAFEEYVRRYVTDHKTAHVGR